MGTLLLIRSALFKTTNLCFFALAFKHFLFFRFFLPGVTVILLKKKMKKNNNKEKFFVNQGHFYLFKLYPHLSKCIKLLLVDDFFLNQKSK